MNKNIINIIKFLIIIIFTISCIGSKKTILLDSYPDKDKRYWVKKIFELYNNNENILNLFLISEILYEFREKYFYVYEQNYEKFHEIWRVCSWQARFIPFSDRKSFNKYFSIIKEIDFDYISEDNLYSLIKLSERVNNHNTSIKSYIILREKYPSSKYILLLDNKIKDIIMKIFETGKYYFDDSKNYYAAEKCFNKIVCSGNSSLYFTKAKEYLKKCEIELNNNPIVFNKDMKYLKEIIVLGNNISREYVILREIIWYGSIPGKQYKGGENIQKAINRLIKEIGGMRFMEYIEEQDNNNLVTIIIIMDEIFI